MFLFHFELRAGYNLVKANKPDLVEISKSKKFEDKDLQERYDNFVNSPAKFNRNIIPFVTLKMALGFLADNLKNIGNNPEKFDAEDTYLVNQVMEDLKKTKNVILGKINRKKTEKHIQDTFSSTSSTKMLKKNKE